jgi:hypothetical protein
VIENQPITFHSGIVLPETDAAGRALDWSFRFSPTDDSLLATQIPGSTRDAPLSLNQDGSLTWDAPPSRRGGTDIYQTQIQAVEAGSGAIFSFDMNVQVLGPQADLDALYYTAAAPAEDPTAATDVPAGGAALIFGLGLCSLLGRRRAA